MITFFSILLILIAINAVLMIFSLKSTDSKARKPEKELLNNVISKVYRMNLTSSNQENVV